MRKGSALVGEGILGSGRGSRHSEAVVGFSGLVGGVVSGGEFEGFAEEAMGFEDEAGLHDEIVTGGGGGSVIAGKRS